MQQKISIAKNLGFLHTAYMKKDPPENSSELRYKQLVGHRIELAIQARGLSQVEVAKTIGISPPKLSHWLKGRHYPNPYYLSRFLNRYNISADWIFRGQLTGMDGDAAAFLGEAAMELPAAFQAKTDQENEN